MELYTFFPDGTDSFYHSLFLVTFPFWTDQIHLFFLFLFVIMQVCVGYAPLCRGYKCPNMLFVFL